LIFCQPLIFVSLYQDKEKKILKIWIPDLKLVLEVLIGELGMTDEKIPGNFNIYFGFLSPNYVTFTIARSVAKKQSKNEFA
ncbi:MAG: hypothetical protein ACE5H1_04945, partial [Thermodesulfobacteriota bacterium]